jgi:hypothetical protein
MQPMAQAVPQNLTMGGGQGGGDVYIDHNGKQHDLVHIHYEPRGACWGTDEGLPKDMQGHNKLKFLMSKGLTQQEWDHWWQALQAVQAKAPTSCEWPCDLVCGLLGKWIWPSCREATGYASREEYWQALTKWQNDFNKECLQRKGLYCKTVSYTGLDLFDLLLHGAESENKWDTKTYLAFSWTPSKTAELQSNPHNQGQIHSDKMTACWDRCFMKGIYMTEKEVASPMFIRV